MNLNKYTLKQYLHRTVRIKFESSIDDPCSMAGVVYEITETQLILLSLDDDENYKIHIDIKKIKNIEKINGVNN